MKGRIEVITYEQDRLKYFTNLMKDAQKRYNRLFKAFKDAPYVSDEAQMLSDEGAKIHFLGDVVEMLDKGYRKQEWISVEDRLPEKEGVYLVHTTYNIIETEVFYISKYDDISYWWDLDGMVTHWMPLPEPPKMKGGE